MRPLDEENRLNESGESRLHGSRIYFSRSAERRFYFIMTLVMLIFGILYKLELI